MGRITFGSLTQVTEFLFIRVATACAPELHYSIDYEGRKLGSTSKYYRKNNAQIFLSATHLDALIVRIVSLS